MTRRTSTGSTWLDQVRAYALKHARRHFLLCGRPHANGVATWNTASCCSTFTLVSLADRRGPGSASSRRSPGRKCGCHLLEESRRASPRAASALHEHLPYLVEFDNFGQKQPGKAEQNRRSSGDGIEITWFAAPARGRTPSDWLRYAWKWVKQSDPETTCKCRAAVSMSPGVPDAPGWYWANTRSEACPQGFNTEDTIKELWGTPK